MSIKQIEFTLEDYSVIASGEWDGQTVTNIDYECNLEVDEQMNDIILDYCYELLYEKFNHDELDFS